MYPPMKILYCNLKSEIISVEKYWFFKEVNNKINKQLTNQLKAVKIPHDVIVTERSRNFNFDRMVNSFC